MSQNLGSESWEEFCARVRASSDIVSWRWAAVARGEHDWNLVALVIEAGSTANPTPRVDRYTTAIVAVEALAAESAAARLLAFTVTADGDGPTVSIPEQQNAVPHRIYSGEEWGLTPGGWPRLVVEAGAGGAVYADPNQPLSRRGMPFYPSVGQAVAERVFRLPPDRVRMNQLAPLSFRLIDRRGRIVALDAEANGMTVKVEEGIEGGLTGFNLHLLWRSESDDDEWSRSKRALTGAENLGLATDGVPAEFLAVLIDPDGEEVDRRVFDRRFRVVAEDPEALEESVVRWIEEGEHAELEYKRELNEKANRSFAETVAAFANGGGGAILVGIDDDGTTIGWRTQKPRDRVTDIVAGFVEETPVFHVDEIRIEGKPIVVVRVAPSTPGRRPHLVRGRAMIRINATTRPANPAQLRNLTAGGS